MISIHAPLTGSDNRSVFGNFRARYFNPRSPHRERLVTAAESGRKRDFNPRSPHRERRKLSKVTVTAYYFNPRSPHRERPYGGIWEQVVTLISIHAPLTGSDSTLLCKKRRTIISIHAPLTGSDRDIAGSSGLIRISIHAPLTGSDTQCRETVSCARYFNPRSPHRERQQIYT